MRKHSLWPPLISSEYSLVELCSALADFKNTLASIDIKRHIETVHKPELLRAEAKIRRLEEFIKELIATPFCTDCILGKGNQSTKIDFPSFPCGKDQHGTAWNYRGSPAHANDTIHLWGDNLLPDDTDWISSVWDANCEARLRIYKYDGPPLPGSDPVENPYSSHKLNIITALWSKCRRFDIAMRDLADIAKKDRPPVLGNISN